MHNQDFSRDWADGDIRGFLHANNVPTGAMVARADLVSVARRQARRPSVVAVAPPPPMAQRRVMMIGGRRYITELPSTANHQMGLLANELALLSGVGVQDQATHYGMRRGSMAPPPMAPVEMNTLSNNPALQMNVANPVINPTTRPFMSAVPESITGGGGGVAAARRGGSSARRRSAASEWTPPTEAEANGHVDRHSPRDLVGETPNQVK